jgi:hypothetical protein
MPRTNLSVALVAFFVLTAGCSFLAPNPDSYTSTHRYSVGIDADTTLEDVTIRIPVPQQGGAATYDVSVLTPNGTVEGAFDAAMVETERGAMLELTAEEFTVETRYYRVVESDGLGQREEISEAEYDPSDPDHQRVEQRTVGVTVSRDVTYPIETRTPVGESPTFYTDDAVTRDLSDCPFPYEDPVACFAYDAPVYLSYDTPADTEVSGSVRFEGSNEWFAGGWTGNSYSDRVGFGATGPQDGWVAGQGRTETGMGTYPAPER